ncbi:MAG: tRNA pseudouridine(55) synthase TruB [Lachnospiraceae bacterium]|nr:tRNA pseudouridine(55) synthase TruB [Lachnospiraceae bacterium]
MINGILNVYKEKGYTSHDVVAKLRGILGQRKIGHTGTLDPDAEGVLPVCLGKATKVCDLLAEKDKVYETVLLLGKVTDTQDVTGTVLEEGEVSCSKEQVWETIQQFVGSCQQIPPMYSALKVNGKKLCDLARAGIEVERKPREIQIFSIQIQETALPRVKMQVHCSKGTYIRTLCHDIGKELKCGGCMESLLRTRVAGFELKDARKLEEIEKLALEARERKQREIESLARAELSKEDLQGFIQNTDCVFQQYPALLVKPKYFKLLSNGNPLKREWMQEWKQEYEEGWLRIYDENQLFAGIYQWEKERKDLRPIKIFMDDP